MLARRDNDVQAVVFFERQHAGRGCSQQTLVIVRADFAWRCLEHFKRNTEIPRQRGNIVMLCNGAHQDQRAIRADADFTRAALGFRDDATGSR